MARVGACAECGETKEIHAFGKCYRCYRRNYTAPRVKCKKCGEVKPHHSRGMCTNCVQKKFYYHHIKGYNVRVRHNISLDLWNEITKECLLCGFDKVVDLHHLDRDHTNNARENMTGLCPNHHKMLHDERFSAEIEAQIKEKLEENSVDA